MNKTHALGMLLAALQSVNCLPDLAEESTSPTTTNPGAESDEQREMQLQIDQVLLSVESVAQAAWLVADLHDASGLAEVSPGELAPLAACQQAIDAIAASFDDECMMVTETGELALEVSFVACAGRWGFDRLDGALSIAVGPAGHGKVAFVAGLEPSEPSAAAGIVTFSVALGAEVRVSGEWWRIGAEGDHVLSTELSIESLGLNGDGVIIGEGHATSMENYLQHNLVLQDIRLAPFECPVAGSAEAATQFGKVTVRYQGDEGVEVEMSNQPLQVMADCW